MNTLSKPTAVRIRRRRASPQTALLAALLAFAACGFWYGQAVIMTPAASGGLALGNGDLDFGEVWEQDDFEWTLPLSNTTKRTVEVVEVKAFCECTAVTPTSFALTPGAIESLRLSLDLTRARGAQPGPLVGERIPVKIEVAAMLRDPPVATHWTLSGTVRSFLTVSPRTVDFVDSLVAGAPFSPRTFRVTCGDAVAGLKAVCDSPDIAVRPSEFYPNTAARGADATCYAFEVRPREGLDVGSIAGRIDLIATGAAGTVLPVTHVAFTGAVVADARATPSRLLRNVELGDVFDDTVLISSRTGAPITVVEAMVQDGLNFKLERVPDESCENAALFRVTAQGFARGMHKGELRFAVQGTGVTATAPVQISVPVRCHVLATRFSTGRGGRDQRVKTKE